VLFFCLGAVSFGILLAVLLDTSIFGKGDSVAGLGQRNLYPPWNLGFDDVVPLRCDAMGGSTEGRRTGARDVRRGDGNKVIWNTSLGSGTLRCGPLHDMSITTRSRYWGGVCRDLAKPSHQSRGKAASLSACRLCSTLRHAPSYLGGGWALPCRHAVQYFGVHDRPPPCPTYKAQYPETRMAPSTDRKLRQNTQTAHKVATGWMGWSQSAIACAAGLGQRQVGSGWRRREVGSRVAGFRAAGRTVFI
jgi:hypothetical protein